MKMFLGVLLIAGVAVGFVQQRRIGEVRAKIDSQNELLAEADRLRAENKEIGRARIEAEQVAAMRADRGELMRLRAGMAELRVAAQSPEQIEAAIEKLNADAERDLKSAADMKATVEAEYFSKALRDVLGGINGVTQFVHRKTGTMPRSFQELERSLAAAASERPGIQEAWKRQARGYPPFHITRDHFEFVPESASKSGVILARERQPRQWPDGTWTRFYLTTDFQMNELRLPDGNFTAWEREH